MKHPAPTGIEAAVCEDIARRQQLGISKYGTSVADNLLPLPAWLQHAYEEALDMAIYLRRAIAEALSAPAKPGIQIEVSANGEPHVVTARRKYNRTHGQYTLHGAPVGVGDLAKLAGCSWATMRQRLQIHSPEAAVAMGPPGRPGYQRTPGHTKAATQALIEGARRYPYAGQELTARELAALAGCTPKVMRLRLLHSTPDRAVAMGAANPVGRRHHNVPEPTAPVTTMPPPAVPAVAAPPAPALRRKVVLRPPAQKAAPVEAIVPANVKRTVAPTPPDRFAVQHAPAHFSARRPGQYDEDAAHTPLARGLATAPKP